MPVLLHQSRSLPKAGFDVWAVAAGPAQPEALHPKMKVKELAAKLESAFDASVEEWWNLARALGQEPSSVLAHAPACAANLSDLGLMLAWTRLVEAWRQMDETVLLVCDDPWLFRHLAGREGVTAGSKPPLWRVQWRLRLRGLLARAKAGWGFAQAAKRLAAQRPAFPRNKPVLLVYGHPASEADGGDAYFGQVMKETPGLSRLLHVDCPPARALALGAASPTFSLHAWGDPAFARTLWKQRWKPVIGGWLVRRAAALEGSTGQAAAIAWQIHCQENWLAAVRPSLVAWPWENHSWERAFVRQAHRLGVATLGYQHATVGWREWNYAPHSNPDGEASLPQRILTVGPADLQRLLRYGCPRNRLEVGGALRFPSAATPAFSPNGPVYVALPFAAGVAREMVEALRPLGARGKRFLVKDHPMSPFRVEPSPGVEATNLKLGQMESVSAVLYCITTVGLESMLAGLPTLRFLPESRVVVDVMPEGVEVAASGAENLEALLAQLKPGARIEREQVFAPAPLPLWSARFQAGA